MSRWVNPALFLAAAAVIGRYNAVHTDDQLVFPLLGALAGPDPAAQGALTWRICAWIGAALLVWATLRTVRDRRLAREAHRTG